MLSTTNPTTGVTTDAGIVLTSDAELEAITAAAAAAAVEDTGFSRLGATHNLSMNQARAAAPTLNSVSAGTRIHTSRSMSGCCMNSAERAYQ